MKFTIVIFSYILVQVSNSGSSEPLDLSSTRALLIGPSTIQSVGVGRAFNPLFCLDMFILSYINVHVYANHICH